MADAKIIIKGQNQLTPAVNQAKGDLNSLGTSAKSLGNTLKTALNVTAVIASIKLLTDAASDCVKSFNEAHRKYLQLSLTLGNSNAFKKATDIINKLSSQTLSSKDAVESMVAELAALGRSVEDIEKISTAAVYLSNVTGKDLNSSMTTLLNTYNGVTTQLTKLGINTSNYTKSELAQGAAVDALIDKYSALSQELSELDSAQTLKNIKDVWGDIKQGLGEGISVALQPAFEYILEMLNKIQSWVDREIKTSVVITKAQRGNSLSEYSDEKLLEAIESLKKSIENGSDRETFTKVINTIQAELDARAAAANTGKSVLGGASTSAVVEETNALEKFLNSYGKNSAAYQQASYEAIIAQAKELQDSLVFFRDDTTTVLRSSVESLGLSSSEEVKATYNYLKEIIDNFTGLITPDELDSVLKSYGSYSNSYQIKNIDDALETIDRLFASASVEEQGYLTEISKELLEQKKILSNIENNTKSENFLVNLGDEIGKWASRITGASESQGGAFGQSVINSLINNLGEAGDMVGNLAQNMATMGPLLGALATALEYVIEGFGEVISGPLNEFVKFGLEPLRELGRVIADLVVPIIQDTMPLVKSVGDMLVQVFNALGVVIRPIIEVMNSALKPILDIIINVLEALSPVLKLFAKILVTVTGTIQYVVQVLQHWVATVMNWLADLNIFGWHPFAGLRMTDPGSPGSYGEYIKSKWASVDAAFEKTVDGSDTSTSTAVQNATYNGATNVTINIYQQAPVVGDGGMLQFAQMIRESFEQLDYYGVSA